MFTVLKKFFLTSFIISSLISHAFAQGKPDQLEKYPDFKQAEELYKKGDFFIAEQYYEKVQHIFPSNQVLFYKIGLCQINYFEYEKAEANLKLVVNNSAEFPLVKYYYAQTLKYSGKYDEAEKYFEQFIKEYTPKPEDPEKYKDIALTDYNGCLIAQQELKKPVRDYGFKNMDEPINSPELDFAPTIYKNDTSLVITSNRDDATGSGKDEVIGNKHTDNYLFNKVGATWEKAEGKDGINHVNTNINEGSGTFNKNHSKFYYTRCDIVSKTSGGECAIYVSEVKNNEWLKPVLLNEHVNFKGYWNGHPALSPTNDTLFFVSKRPEGKGMHDIWYCIDKSHKDNWGPAKNLKEINTPFSEVAPTCYHKDKKFFFASNGLEGMGGLDIFEADLSGFKHIRNIGLPFNSPRDDFYFVLGQNKGYITSNRKEGKGKDDIYTFNIKSKEAFISIVKKDSIKPADKTMTVNGQLSHVDKTSKIENVGIILTNEKGKPLSTTKTNKAGEFVFAGIPTNQDYHLKLDEKDATLTTKGNYTIKEINVKGHQSEHQLNSYEYIFFEFNEATLRSDALKTLDDIIVFLKQNPNAQLEVRGHTDSLGAAAFNKTLAEERANNTIDYLHSKGLTQTSVVLSVGSESNIAPNHNPIGRQLNRRLEFYISNASNHKPQAVAYILEPKDNIYSIAKKFRMTPAELKELNGMEEIDFKPFRSIRVKKDANAHPIYSETIELANSDKYNNLNQLYSFYKFIDGKFVKGEDLIDNPNSITFDFAGYDLIDYTVLPGNTIYSIATEHNMLVPELEQLNKTASVKIGQVIKVKRVK